MIHSQEFTISTRSIHTRSGDAGGVLLLSPANEWALETCTFLSQLFEICPTSAPASRLGTVQVHAYAGVCRYGATNLVFATGTTSLSQHGRA